MDKDVLHVEGYGATGITLKGWTDKNMETPTLFAQCEWEGLKGVLTIIMGWGWVEFEREWTVVDGGPLTDEWNVDLTKLLE